MNVICIDRGDPVVAKNLTIEIFNVPTRQGGLTQTHGPQNTLFDEAQTEMLSSKNV